MFDLEGALQKWRIALSAESRLTSEQMDELEVHVRDVIDCVSSDELSDEEKFLVATQRLGHPAHLREEYEKLTPWATWRVPMFWAMVGVACVLGVEAVLDLAVPTGAMVAARLNLPLVWLEGWAFVVCVGGPLVAFASVALWMRRYSAAHLRSEKAVFATVTVAAALRLGSVPLLSFLNSTAWRSFDARTGRAFQTVWQAATVVGFCVVAGVAAVVLVRFRELRNRAIRSR
jgi:hypothetical protein